ncbi:MAG: TOBE domain-containing protein, partial [Anaerolineae bacterium]
VEAWEGNVVEGIADVTEPLGDQILATLDTGHESLQATLPADTSARPDQPIRLRVDLSKIHLFDPNTEETIC